MQQQRRWGGDAIESRSLSPDSVLSCGDRHQNASRREKRVQVSNRSHRLHDKMGGSRQAEAEGRSRSREVHPGKTVRRARFSEVRPKRPRVQIQEKGGRRSPRDATRCRAEVHYAVQPPNRRQRYLLKFPITRKESGPELYAMPSRQSGLRTVPRLGSRRLKSCRTEK